MKLKIVFSSLIFSFCCICYSSTDISAQEIKLPVRRSTGFSDLNYAYKLTDQDFVNTPSWNQNDGEPPLAINRAVKIARENLPRFVKNAET